MAILHKNISAEGDIHNPKWFSGANNGDVAWRNELGILESTDELVLPAALDFVDGSAAPPTSNSGDIYVLSSGASVNAGWGTVALGDWVRYDGTTWNVITPQKSSLCYNETTDALNSYDGSAWSEIGGGTDADAVHVNVPSEISGITSKATPTSSDLLIIEDVADGNNKKKITIGDLPSSGGATGIIGIADASGSYTYYNTFALALAAASGGDTIQIFTDIIETSDITVTCVNNVNINFNGFTYTLNTSGNSNAFTLGAGVTMSMFNGRILRTGGAASSVTRVAIRASGAGTFNANSMTFENDFGTGAYFASSTRSVIGGKFYGATIGCYLVSATLDNAYASAGSSYGMYFASGSSVNNCNAYSLSGYGMYNNGGSARDCKSVSSGSVGFYHNVGNSYGCKGYSNANYGAVIAGSSGDVSDIFGYSSAGSGVNLARSANNIVGVSTSSYGVRYSSGSGNQVFSNVTASSTSASALYILKNTGKAEFSNINIITTWNDANAHAVTVSGSSNNISISQGTLRVENSSANCIYSSLAKSLYFVGLAFTNSTTAVNANITNLQSNTPDAFGNILIG